MDTDNVWAIASIPTSCRLRCIRSSLWCRFTRCGPPLSALSDSRVRVRDQLGDSIFHFFHCHQVCNRLCLRTPGPAKTNSYPNIYQHECHGRHRNTRLDIRLRQLHSSCGDVESVTVSPRLAKYHTLHEALTKCYYHQWYVSKKS